MTMWDPLILGILLKTDHPVQWTPFITIIFGKTFLFECNYTAYIIWRRSMFKKRPKNTNGTKESV